MHSLWQLIALDILHGTREISEKDIRILRKEYKLSICEIHVLYTIGRKRNSLKNKYDTL